MEILEAFEQLNKNYIKEDFEPFLIEKEVGEIFWDCVRNCKRTKNFELNINEDHLIFDGIVSKGTSHGDNGSCEVIQEDDHFIYHITVKDLLCHESTKKYLINTIYHELAHVLELDNAALKFKLLLHTNKSEAQKFWNKFLKEYKTVEHTSAWHRIADLMNKEFKLDPPIAERSAPEEETAVAKANKNAGGKYSSVDDVENPGIIINCSGDSCDLEEYPYNTPEELKTNPKLFNIVKRILLKPGSVKCPRCRTDMYMYFQQEWFEDSDTYDDTKRMNAWKEKLKNM